MALPTLISHGELHSLQLGRPLLAEEWFLSQGWPLYRYGPIETAALFEDVPARWKLSEKSLKDLCGNSIHLAICSALLAWILSGLVEDKDHKGDSD